MHPIVYENPAWTNSALLRQWDEIERLVGAGKMPKVTKHTADKLIAVEYGTGAYGTVMPTRTRGLVVKVTSDPTEARFAYIASTRLKKYPEGLVEYGKVLRLHGKHEQRPMFVLWREEAYDVGKAIDEDSDVAEELMLLRQYADPAFQLLNYPDVRASSLGPVMESARSYKGKTGYENHGSGPGVIQRIGLAFANEEERAGYGLNAAYELADDIAHGKNARLVGAAIRDLMKQGLLLADVHLGNVGRVKRHGQLRTVITDPGHVTFLTDSYEGIEPPSIEEISTGHRARVRGYRAAYSGTQATQAAPQRARARRVR